MRSVCDCLVALPGSTADGITRFAKNSDRPADEAQLIEWHPPRRVAGGFDTTYLKAVTAGRGTDSIGVLGSRPEWMWGFEHGVNTAGVAIGNETIYTTVDPRPFPPALTGMDIVRLALETSPTAAAAVDAIAELIDRYGQGGSGHRGKERPYWSSFLVADPGAAYVVETSARDLEVEPVSSTRAISNRTTIPSFDAAHRHPRQPVEALVDPRWNASKAVLAQGDVTADRLKAHLRSHVGGDDGWTVCMHVDGVESTTAAMVADLSSRPLARMLLGSPCRSIFVPMTVGAPAGDPLKTAEIEASGAGIDELLALEDDLEREVLTAGADPDWNAYAWSRVRALVSRGR
ncbi:MAG TPA: hypothetical protein VM345_03650 [Acidimicrobiales bacterium]|jgi:secernin|nr:hypothetical protein [Acidimicrobiales bacterium]